MVRLKMWTVPLVDPFFQLLARERKVSRRKIDKKHCLRERKNSARAQYLTRLRLKTFYERYDGYTSLYTAKIPRGAPPSSSLLERIERKSTLVL